MCDVDCAGLGNELLGPPQEVLLEEELSSCRVDRCCAGGQTIVFLMLGNNRAFFFFLEHMESFTSAIIIIIALFKYYLSYFLRKRIRLPIFDILLSALVSNVISWIYLLKIKLKIHIFT